MLQYIVQLALMRTTTNLSSRDQKLLSDFPVDIRSAAEKLHLDGKSTIYAVCPDPKCHRTYAPTFQDGSPIPSYPTYCTHRQFRGGKCCKTRLLWPRSIAGVEISLPIKTFVYWDFKDWVGGLLSRPGYEGMMDSAWETRNVDQSKMHDIFHGSILQGFKGPDKKTHFSLGGDEGRYTFSLCVDFFNPLTNRQAGKKISVGMISLICLNLPPDIRYKPENMFLAGVVPGPREPPPDTFHHYLTPLVDQFLEFWDPGVQFSRTQQHPHGRLVRCALVALVCDIPAARKISGFAASSHNHFCSICHCTRQEHGYGNIEYHIWRRRTKEECYAAAERYQNASDDTERLTAFTASGMRWSELLRLPYFDPTRFVVVDAMHNLFLGLIKEHFDGIIGIRLEKDSADQKVLEVRFSDAWHTFSDNEQKSTKKLVRWLQSPLCASLATDSGRLEWKKRFHSLHERVLSFACSELHCEPSIAGQSRKTRITKFDMADALIDWVCTINI